MELDISEILRLDFALSARLDVLSVPMELQLPAVLANLSQELPTISMEMPVCLLVLIQREVCLNMGMMFQEIVLLVILPALLVQGETQIIV